MGFCHVSVIRIGQWSCGTRDTVWVHERERKIMARSVRADILDLIDDGELSAYGVVHMALCYMSVADIEDMMRRYDIVVGRALETALESE